MSPPKMVSEPLNCSQSLVYVRTLIMYIVLTKNWEEFTLHTIWLIKYNSLYFKEGYDHIFIGYLSNQFIVLVYKAMETMITIIGYVKMMNVDQLYLMNYGFINMLCILSKNTKFASVR